MNKNMSENIAFFNLLKGVVSQKLKNEKLDYTISIHNFSSKINIEEKVVYDYFKKLEKINLITISSEVDNTLTIHFEKSHEKVIDTISIGELDVELSTLTEFIENKISYFKINELNLKFPTYALEMKEIMNKKGSSMDVKKIISKGIKELMSIEKNRILINKTILDISKNATNEEIKIIEKIFSYKLNLPAEENPFYVTLFLTIVSYYIQIS